MLMEASFNNQLVQQDLISELVADKRSENTKRAYRNDLEDFFQTVTGRTSSPGVVQQFLKLTRSQAVTVVLRYKASLIERGLKEATINRRLAAIRSLVNHARRVDMCDWKLDDVEGEKVESYRDTTGVTVQQIAEMLKIPNRKAVKGKRDYAILRIFWELALRRGEVSKLNLEDFDPELSTVSVLGKGKGTQKVSMNLSEKTKEAILEWLDTREEIKPGDPLFIALDRSFKGNRLTGEGLSKIIKGIAKKAGITKTMSPHRLRHTSITAALEATNGNVALVQKLSRHAKVETVMVYEDRRVNQQKKVTDLLADLA
ncbi:tyrosine-type recombinase/integrase [Ammoniphilus resinae]|uniref:Integrase/recombinase XerC n=1 Tax=Ammoniphilus resinae TaxID=861532 RepID=A0ABS4GX59_9BACL|nr:tyrosine-type recombinase/integrase [Ammoniphilus resinae]MBP1934868.1 integrase/recombinase XerC [Ammoniphilus resinae]